jgi:hypothetical protein
LLLESGLQKHIELGPSADAAARFVDISMWLLWAPGGKKRGLGRRNLSRLAHVGMLLWAMLAAAQLSVEASVESVAKPCALSAAANLQHKVENFFYLSFPPLPDYIVTDQAQKLTKPW